MKQGTLTPLDHLVPHHLQEALYFIWYSLAGLILHMLSVVMIVIIDFGFIC